MVSALHCLSYVSAVVGLIFVLLSLGTPLDPVATLSPRELTLDALCTASGLLYSECELYPVEQTRVELIGNARR